MEKWGVGTGRGTLEERFQPFIRPLESLRGTAEIPVSHSGEIPPPPPNFPLKRFCEEELDGTRADPLGWPEKPPRHTRAHECQCFQTRGDEEKGEASVLGDMKDEAPTSVEQIRFRVAPSSHAI